MAYSGLSGKLPAEKASKISHTEILAAPLVREQIQEFKALRMPYEVRNADNPLRWQKIPDVPSEITDVIVCDGSNYDALEEGCRIAFVRASILRIPAVQTGKPLHPVAFRRLLEDNSDSVAAALPVMIPCSGLRVFSRCLRTAVFRTISYRPAVLETFLWLFRRGWIGNSDGPLDVSCPCCKTQLRFRDENEMDCPDCGERVYVTDLLRFDSDITDAFYDPFAATRVTSVQEFLMLVTCMRDMFEHDPDALSHTMFLHDGPLSIGGHYESLLYPIHEFLIYACEMGRPVIFCGVEKSSMFTAHFQMLDCSCMYGNQFAVPSRRYIQREIRGKDPDADYFYGQSNILGEKVFVHMKGRERFVVSIPSLELRHEREGPDPDRLICRDQIMRVLPTLVTPLYDNALYPITCVNSLVSISNFPGGHMLELMLREEMK